MAEKAHGHLCAGQILGVRMALCGLRQLGIDDPTGVDRKRLVTFVEIDRCATDAICVVTGCRLGKRALKFRDFGKMAATFCDFERTRRFVWSRWNLRRTVPAHCIRKLRRRISSRCSLIARCRMRSCSRPNGCGFVSVRKKCRATRPVALLAMQCGEGINFSREVVRTAGRFANLARASAITKCYSACGGITSPTVAAARDLMDCITRAAADGVELIQIREKDLHARDLLELVRAAVLVVSPWPARILVNGRADVALTAKAHGIHLPSDSIVASEWRRILPQNFLIGVSCHSVADIQASEGADFVVYGPVFESPGKGSGVGLDALRVAVGATGIPVFALGGITKENAALCADAGAAGVAAIRMFQGE